MKGFRLLTVSLLIICLVLTGCGSRNGDGNGTNGAGDGVIVLKFGHADSETRSSHLSALEFKEFIERESAGRVVVEIYPNNQLGDDDDVIKGIGLGTAHLWVGTQGSVSSVLGEALDFIDLPFLYESYEDWSVAMFEQGGLELYNQLLNEKGYTAIDFQYDGQRSMINTKRPINTLEDLSGLKMRVTSSKLFLEFFRAVGANPTPMSFSEVYTGLSQGAIDGMDHSAGVLCDQKIYEVAKYFSLTNHITSTAPVVMSTSFLESLPEDIQELVITGLKAASANQRELEYSLEQEFRQTLLDNGVEINEISAAERARFVAAVTPLYDMWRQYSGDEIIDAILATASK